MITPQDYIDSFIKQDHFSTYTKYFYKSHIIQFLDYLIKMKLINRFPKKITESNIRGFLIYLQDIGLKDISINAKFAALKSFYRWARKNHRINNPTYGVQQKKRIDFPKIIKEKDLQRLLEYIKRLPPEKNKLRDSCLIHLFYETGAKINEIQKLNIKNIDFKLNQIKINKRIMYISNDLENNLQKYIKSRERNPLFMNKYNKRITGRGISRIIENRSKKCNIFNINCSSFRDAYAYRVQKRGLSHKNLAEVLGLQNPDSTHHNYKNFIIKD